MCRYCCPTVIKTGKWQQILIQLNIRFEENALSDLRGLQQKLTAV
jgi:hypothetical protein